MFGHDRLRMELYSFHVICFVSDGHHFAKLIQRGHFQLIPQLILVHIPAVIVADAVFLRNVPEQSVALLFHLHLA